MFYANNEQVKGIFLNGRNYNYLAYGFGKIIPEDRNVEQLNLNLAEKYLNQYRIEWGTVKDGYENALVSSRFDKPDYNGVFHTPFTYYHNGNIIPTKQVPVLITDGNYALMNALVYNDMNINGAINYFASNTDFMGHNVNVFPEKDNYQSAPLLNHEMLNNCSNFDLNISTRFSKMVYPTLYNCNNFYGNFKYVGNSDNKCPGFRGFLYECKDGVFNIDCTNMRGGGSDANVRNYFKFSGISNCDNIKLNITGSSWQIWPHDHSFSRNCNINTYNVISGFSYMNDCNFNIVLPKDSKPEMDKGFEFLSNAENCNYNLYATDVNLFNYRSGVGHAAFFEDLNNCNLNLLVNNTVSFSYSFCNRLNNCNIVFDNIKADLSTFIGWYVLNNCNISGNVESTIFSRSFLEHCYGINVNINAAKSSNILAMWKCNNANGNFVAGDRAYIYYSIYQNLNVSGGNLVLINVEHSRYNSNGTNFNTVNLNNCMFEIYNSKDFVVHNANTCNFNMRNSTGNANLYNINNVKFVERYADYNITSLDNCYNSWISANTLTGTIENAYNTRLELRNDNTYFETWKVNKCEITGFPSVVNYTTNCTFNAPIHVAVYRNGSYATWNNLWPHASPRGSDGWEAWYGTNAGLRSVDNFSCCRLNCNNGSLVAYGGSENFSNSNNMQLDIRTFYYGTVTANLPVYNLGIKLNVDCHHLNLGIIQDGPPHGFRNATISADNIYAKGNIPGAYIYLNSDVKLYCANYCNTAFYIGNVRAETDALQPVVLINNYQFSNSSSRELNGGLTRIGRLNFQGGVPASLDLRTGACVFINNATLGYTLVRENSLLFLGSNVRFTGALNVLSGSLVVNKENWSSHASDVLRHVDRGHLCWNIWDYGPWGPRSLFNFCIDV